jgi:glycopeptide antibiotics resistance protein
MEAFDNKLRYSFHFDFMFMLYLVALVLFTADIIRGVLLLVWIEEAGGD